MGAALPWIAVAATAMGSIIQAQGAKQQADATAAQNQYQAAVARNDQILAEQAAQAAEARGSRLSQMKQLDTASRLGGVIAATGGAGLDSGSGSALRLQADTQAMGDLDTRTIRYNAAREAYGYRVQGSGYSAQAQLDEMAARDAGAAGNLAATGSIISGGASVADKWMRYKQVGVVS